jgi:hypothetical protein
MTEKSGAHGSLFKSRNQSCRVKSPTQMWQMGFLNRHAAGHGLRG